jgi:hypothetical protein
MRRLGTARQTYFCYTCGKRIAGYDHFRDGGCQLFTLQEIQDWEARMDAMDMNRNVQLAHLEGDGMRLDPQRARRVLGYCPNCRQASVKVSALVVFPPHPSSVALASYSQGRGEAATGEQQQSHRVLGVHKGLVLPVPQGDQGE